MMKALGVIGVVVVLIVTVWVVRGMRSGSSGDMQTIVLTDQGFVPRELRIVEGTQVRFITDMRRDFWPASDLHPAHAIYPEFDPKAPLGPDDVWEFTFDRVGTWGMHDHIRSYFTGVI